MRLLPMSFYLAALSCADTSVLWVSTVYLVDRQVMRGVDLCHGVIFNEQ